MKTATRAFGTLAVAAAAAISFGSGTAVAADPLVGKTLKDASAVMSENWNATAVVESVVGSLLDRDSCIVTSWHKSAYLDSSGNKRGTSNIYVNLNCNAAVASAGTPGNSAESAVGRQEVKNNETAEYMNSHPEYCLNNAASCDWFCTKYADKCTNWPVE
jgi:hypothetical protein